MSSKASGLKTAVDDFIRRRGIEAGMAQNLMKEAIHLHLLSALSEAGVLRHVVFQGGTALRLCYGGERYSEDLDFVCGKAGAYLKDIEFDALVDKALETAKKTLQRDLFRDVWDVWFLVSKLGATPDREMVLKKFADYGVADIAVRAHARHDELARDVTAAAFYAEMRRFLPSARVAQMAQMNLQRTMLAGSASLIVNTVLPEVPPELHR
jgi:predicted nucleotidyltransferase component of viral defense system